RAQMAFYLDDELQDNERATLETHLRYCVACRERFDQERQFLETIREASPLHSAPPGLRAEVENLLSEAPSPHTAPPALRERIERSLWRSDPTASRDGLRRWLAIAAIVVIASLLGLWAFTAYRNRPHPNQPSDFALMAVDTHQRHLRGQLPLEIATAEP